LQWSDFRVTSKVPSKLSKGQGCCTSAISLDWTIEFLDESQTKFKFTDIETKAFFVKEKSWQKPWVPFSLKDELLKHEQGHFDLCESGARNLKTLVEKKIGARTFSCKGKTIEELENNSQKRAQKITDKIRQGFHKKYFLEQINYDKFTNHGDNRKKQAEYNEKFWKLRN